MRSEIHASFPPKRGSLTLDQELIHRRLRLNSHRSPASLDHLCRASSRLADGNIGAGLFHFYFIFIGRSNVSLNGAGCCQY